MALRSATSLNSALPTTRTVVNPASSVCCACAAPSNAIWLGSSVSPACCQSPSPIVWEARCTWASTNPGSTVSPDRSMTVAPAGTCTFAPTAGIVIQGDRITAVGAHVQVPAGATVIDLSGETVLPGFVDAHVHLASHTIGDGDWQHAWLTELPSQI